MKTSDLPPAIYLMGPTASGKTALSIQLAHQLEGEIISVDSAMIYRGMDIGTAKPSMEEREGIVHHLIDILDPSEAYSTGQFKHQAHQIMDEITRRGRLPILVGGTMLYFNTLINGLAELPPADKTVRRQLEEDLLKYGKEAMHQRLAEIDPQAAARIHPNDPQRIQRALEVYEISGKPISAYFNTKEQSSLPYHAIQLIIAPKERKKLHELIAKRFKNMLKLGLVDEVSRLYRRGDLNESMPAIRSVGYRQVWSYLKGEYDFDTMTEKGIIATRQLAKRQFTWLRKFDQAHQFNNETPDLLRQIMKQIPFY